MSRYGVKEVVNTLQGEGSRAGTRAVFVRFTGCNFWDGHPLHRDRGLGPCARWCDADFFQGEVLGIADLLGRMEAAWPRAQAQPDGDRWCVLTGGEPLLQVDHVLVEGLHAEGWKIALETNGTVEHPELGVLDHVCVSPKRGAACVVRCAHELKVVLPGAAEGEEGWTDEELDALGEEGAWGARFVQPQDVLTAEASVGATVLRGGSAGNAGVDEVLDLRYRQHLQRAVDFVMRRPAWRLSVQAHKFVGLP